MFREMRRFRQKLGEKECVEILNSGREGVLAVSGDDGYPYAVPLNFVYKDGVIYFHCAKSGHKLDAIRKDGKASFCVIDKGDIVQEKFTTYFRSIIAFGRVSEVSDDGEKYESVKALAEKYCPDFKEGIPDEIKKEWAPLNVLKFEIEHLSGKQAKELIKAEK